MYAWMSGTLALGAEPHEAQALEYLQRTLTLWQRQQHGPSIQMPFWMNGGRWTHIPRAYPLSPEGAWLVPWLRAMDNRSSGWPLPPGSSVTGIEWGAPPFPPGQRQAITDIVSGCRANGLGGVFVAPTRSGKTLISIQAAMELGGHVLIIVTQDNLKGQFIRDVEKFVRDAQGRPVPVGVIQRERFDVDKPIVVAMAQTLMNRDIPPEVRRKFGTIIVDECDSAPCDLIMGALVRFDAAYIIGLSATPDRKDGLEQAIFWLIGPVIAELTREMRADVAFVPIPYTKHRIPKVRKETGEPYMGFPRIITFGTLNRVEAEKAMMADPVYTSTVADMLFRAHDEGRHVLALAGLRAHIALVVERLRQRGANPGSYVGGNTTATEMAKSPCIGTFKAAAKGVDFQPPPTLLGIFGPITDVRQAMGRGLQPQAPCRPLILDFVYGHRKLIQQAYRRLEYYKAKGFTIRNEPWPWRMPV